MRQLHWVIPGRGHKIGLDRKGYGLGLIGLVWVVIGIGIPEQPIVHGAWHMEIPVYIRAGWWIFAGLMSIASAWLRYLRPWTMAILVIMPGLNFFSYMTAWVLYLVDGGNPGYSRGLASAVSSVLMIMFVFYIATDTTENDSVNELNKAIIESNGHDAEGEP